MLLAIMQGAVLFGAVLALYAVELGLGAGEANARTQAMIALIAGNLALALSESNAGSALFDRSRQIFWSIVAIALAVFGLLIALPVTAHALRMTPIGAPSLLLALAVGLLAGGWFGAFNRTKAAFGLWSKDSMVDRDQASSSASQ
jgi:hypothetical protein